MLFIRLLSVVLSFASLFCQSCQHVEEWSVENFQHAVLNDKDTEDLRWYYVGSDSNFDYFRNTMEGELIREIRVDITKLPLPERRMYSTDSRDWNELYPKE